MLVKGATGRHHYIETAPSTKHVPIESQKAYDDTTGSKSSWWWFEKPWRSLVISMVGAKCTLMAWYVKNPDEHCYITWFFKVLTLWPQHNIAEKPCTYSMGILPDTQNCGLRMRRECRERFSPPPFVSDPDMRHGTCVEHAPWCMPGSLTSGFFWNRRRGKRSRHSRRMHNPQFCVSGKRPMGQTLSDTIWARSSHRLKLW